MLDGIKGLLFDKDGTLFDFRASWAPIYAEALAALAGGDPARAERLAGLAGFDLAARDFRPGSILVAGTSAEILAHLAPALPAGLPGDLEDWLNARFAEAGLVPVTELGPFADRLAARGLVLGIATNDAERAARAHLAAAGALDRFGFVAGYDTGWGAKPGPGMVRAFARWAGLDPAAVAMVGDSRHDLEAGRAAGARTVGVLTGPAGAAELAPHADLVLPSVLDLAALLCPE